MLQKIALGVDLGWMTQLENIGMCWVGKNGEKMDLLDAVIEKGADSVRLRVFVNPPKGGYWQKDEATTCMLGYCDGESVLEASKRIAAKGLRLMLDFHYSNYFADGQIQDIPSEWQNDTDDELAAHLHEHTKEVLMLLKNADISPEWVQVGNETNIGLMLPRGSFRENPQLMVRLFNSGYDAVKECFPECSVITHLAGANAVKECTEFFDKFFELGGKTDILGFSHYPYWNRQMNPDDPGCFINPLITYAQRYNKSVMVCEVGEDATKPQQSARIVADAIEAVLQVPNSKGLGVFYWEPEVSADMLPDSYPLGAARLVADRTLQLTEALDVYNKYKEGEK